MYPTYLSILIRLNGLRRDPLLITSIPMTRENPRRRDRRLFRNVPRNWDQTYDTKRYLISCQKYLDLKNIISRNRTYQIWLLHLFEHKVVLFMSLKENMYPLCKVLGITYGLLYLSRLEIHMLLKIFMYI